MGMIPLPRNMPYLEGMVSDMSQLSGFLKSRPGPHQFYREEMLALLIGIYGCTAQEAEERLPYIRGYLITLGVKVWEQPEPLPSVLTEAD